VGFCGIIYATEEVGGHVLSPRLRFPSFSLKYMSIENFPKESYPIRERYVSKADKDGYVWIGDFATQELGRQSKNVGALLDGEEGTSPEHNLGDGLRYKGSSGNYSDMSIHIDDLATFIERVKNYFQ
jgi:hypothetical protein